MKVILTRSKPLSGRISASLSAICHAVVGGLQQNTKGQDASRHNSAREEKYIMKQAWRRRGEREKKGREANEKVPGILGGGVGGFVRFVGFVGGSQIKKHRERKEEKKRGRKRAAGGMLRGSNIMSSSCSG